MNHRGLHAFMLFIGDVALFYLALFLTLVLRYANLPAESLWNLHFVPMSIMYILWIAVLYIAGLYEINRFFSLSELTPIIMKTMGMNAGLGITIFYIVPFFTITPKINLLINVLISTVFILLWRRIFLQRLHARKKMRVLFFGKNKELETLAYTLNNNPYLGYSIRIISSEENLKNIVTAQHISLIVVASNIYEDPKFTNTFFEALKYGVGVISFPNFYEEVTGKIPVSEISQRWFLDNILETRKRIFDSTQRILDITFGILFSIGIFILLPFVAILIKLENGGPIFVKQTRVGKNGKIFTVHKFRSMRVVNSKSGLAENSGAQWTTKNDPRVTRVGKILRKTHIDELPQMLSILKGDMSFVGPRPERPEFVERLKKEVPFYDMRHLIKPGFTGWAQINFPAGASIDDALEKLQYDLFYIKNRSVGLDLVIIIKTGKLLFGWGDLA